MTTRQRRFEWCAAVLTLLILGCAVLVARPGAGSEAAAPPEAPQPPSQTEWPMFGGSPQRNPVNLREAAFEHWAVEKKDQQGKVISPAWNIKWSVPLGSRTYGGPVIAGGKIFVGTNNADPRNPKIKGDKGILMCFRESDGQFLWQAVHDKLAGGIANDWPNQGIASHPVVEGGRVYYVSNRCELICADVNGFLDGKNDGVQDEQYQDKTDADIVWRLDMMKDLKVLPHCLAACSPLIVGELVFVVTGNGVDEVHINIPSPSAPSFLAVEKKTGKVRWQNNSPTRKAVGVEKMLDYKLYEKSALKGLVNRGEVLMHAQWSNPAYAVVRGKPQVIFPGGDGWLYGFEPETGKLIWKFDANPKDAKYELGGRGTRSDFIATPVVVGDRLYIGTGQDPEHYEGVGHLWCIDITRTGDVSPELVVDGKVFPPKTKPNPNSAVVWHHGGPTTKEDEKKYHREFYFGRTMSTVAVHKGLVFAPEISGYVHCLDAGTGKPYWTYEIPCGIWSSPHVIGDRVYVGTEDGDVWIFEASAICRVRKTIEIGRPIYYTGIVAVNRVLYVASDSRLYAVANQ